MCLQELGIDCHPNLDCVTCLQAKSRPVSEIPAIGGEAKEWKVMKETLTADEIELACYTVGKDLRNLLKFFRYKYGGGDNISARRIASGSSTASKYSITASTETTASTVNTRT